MNIKNIDKHYSDIYNWRMKKFMLLLFIFMPSIISAFDGTRGDRGHFVGNYDFRWNLGNIGIERNFQDNSNIRFFDFFDVTLRHNRTRIGLEFTPVRIWELQENGSWNTASISFLNLGIFWNALDIIFSNDHLNFFTGPFSRVNYMHLGNNNALNWNRVVYNAGLRFGLVASDYGITVNNFWRAASVNFVNGEVGFRNINGVNTFYASVSTNIVLFVVMYFFSLFNLLGFNSPPFRAVMIIQSMISLVDE